MRVRECVYACVSVNACACVYACVSVNACACVCVCTLYCSLQV